MTGTLDKTSNVHELNGSRDHFLRVGELRQHLKTRIRNCHNTYIRLNGAEGEISCLRLSILNLYWKRLKKEEDIFHKRKVFDEMPQIDRGRSS